MEMERISRKGFSLSISSLSLTPPIVDDFDVAIVRERCFIVASLRCCRLCFKLSNSAIRISPVGS
jgi:hypothetical protein